MADLDRRISAIEKGLSEHASELSRLISSMNDNLGTIIPTHEFEAGIFLFTPASRFAPYLDNISPPKSRHRLWERPRNDDGRVEFQFRTINARPQVIERFSVDPSPGDGCLVNDFYLGLRLGRGPELATRVFRLTQDPWKQNFTLPFPVKFYKMTIWAGDNHDGSQTICLPDVRVYQRIGFLT
jgi:hypothetical protein